ncbi:MAG: ribosome assembly cofactor RimP [Flavobacteriaceae bacterium]|nr:ribosome assembly cofactor RimP [Flavobacteriaceae bacterium]
MNNKTILNLVNEALIENKSIFIVDLKISDSNKIILILDGDNGVPLKECIRINRFIESNLDREQEDFSLEVTSPNIAEPLKNKRQYNKNIGRIVKIKTITENFEGTLVQVDLESVIINWKVREPKKIGKGKVTVKKTATIAFKQIIETKVKIIF